MARTRNKQTVSQVVDNTNIQQNQIDPKVLKQILSDLEQLNQQIALQQQQKAQELAQEIRNTVPDAYTMLQSKRHSNIYEYGYKLYKDFKLTYDPAMLASKIHPALSLPVGGIYGALQRAAKYNQLQALKPVASLIGLSPETLQLALVSHYLLQKSPDVFKGMYERYRARTLYNKAIPISEHAYQAMRIFSDLNKVLYTPLFTAIALGSTLKFVPSVIHGFGQIATKYGFTPFDIMKLPFTITDKLYSSIASRLSTNIANYVKHNPHGLIASTVHNAPEFYKYVYSAMLNTPFGILTRNLPQQLISTIGTLGNIPINLTTALLSHLPGLSILSTIGGDILKAGSAINSVINPFHTIYPVFGKVTGMNYLLSHTVSPLFSALGLTSFAKLAASPAIAGMVAFASLGMITSLARSFAMRKYRPRDINAYEIEQQTAASPMIRPYLNTLIAVDKNVKPIDILQLQVLMLIEQHTSIIPLLYNLLHQNIETKHVTSEEARDIIYSEIVSPYESHWYEKPQKFLESLNIRFNPAAQLLTWLTTGLSPKEFIDKVLYREENRRKEIESYVSNWGVNYTTASLLATEASNLIHKAKSYESKVVTLLAGIYDLNRAQLQELITIRKYGFGLKESVQTQEDTGIPYRTVFEGLLSSAFKLAKGYVKLSLKPYEYLYRKFIKKESIKDIVTSELKDLNETLKNAPLFTTIYDLANISKNALKYTIAASVTTHKYVTTTVDKLNTVVDKTANILDKSIDITKGTLNAVNKGIPSIISGIKNFITEFKKAENKKDYATKLLARNMFIVTNTLRNKLSSTFTSIFDKLRRKTTSESKKEHKVKELQEIKTPIEQQVELLGSIRNILAKIYGLVYLYLHSKGLIKHKTKSPEITKFKETEEARTSIKPKIIVQGEEDKTLTQIISNTGVLKSLKKQALRPVEFIKRKIHTADIKSIITDIRSKVNEQLSKEKAIENVGKVRTIFTDVFNKIIQRIPKFQKGGEVPGVDKGKDEVLALLRPGEVVLSHDKLKEIGKYFINQVHKLKSESISTSQLISEAKKEEQIRKEERYRKTSIEYLQDIDKNITKLTKLFEIFKDMFKPVKDDSLDIFSALASAYFFGKKAIKKVLSTVFRKALQPVFEKIISLLPDSFVESLTGIFSGIAEKFGGNFLVKALGSILPKFIGKAVPFGAGAGLVEWLTGGSTIDIIGSAVGGAIGGALGSVLGPIGTFFGSAIGSELGKYVFNKLYNVISNFDLSSLKEKAVNAITSIFSFGKDVVKDILAFIVGEKPDKSTVIGAGLGAIIGAPLGPFGMLFTSKIGAVLLPKIIDFIQTIPDKISKYKDTTIKFLSDISKKLKLDTFTNIFKKIFEFPITVIKLLIKGIVTGIEGLIDKLPDIPVVSTVKEKLLNLIKPFKEFVSAKETKTTTTTTTQTTTTSAASATQQTAKLVNNAATTTTTEISIGTWTTPTQNLNQILQRQIMTESGGNVYATSSAGAKGLAQFTPATWEWIWSNKQIFSKYEPEINKFKGIPNIFDPNAQKVAQRAYMKYLINKFNGSIEWALAAYNWGIGNAKKLYQRYKGDFTKAFNHLPRETQQYITKILGYDYVKQAKEITDKASTIVRTQVARLQQTSAYQTAKSAAEKIVHKTQETLRNISTPFEEEEKDLEPVKVRDEQNKSQTVIVNDNTLPMLPDVLQVIDKKTYVFINELLDNSLLKFEDYLYKNVFDQFN